MMPQNVIHWGVGKQSHLCLSSESIPQPRRNKPSLLLYDCVCVVSWPEDLAVRSHIRPNRKVYKKKRVLLTFGIFCRGTTVTCVRFTHKPPHKELLKAVEEGAYFKQAALFICDLWW